MKEDTRMKRSKKINSFVDALLSLSVFLAIVLLWYVNLVDRKAYDLDFSNVAIHAREMVNSRSIFIENWISKVSSLELDCSSLFAIPIYAITGRIYASFAISNILNTLLWGGTVYYLLKKSGVSYRGICIALGLVFLHWGYGMLDYTNMMFYMAGQYVYKSLVPILFLCVLISRPTEKKVIRFLIAFTYYFLLFITSVSTGSYVFLCGIIPIIICLLVFFLSKSSPIPNKRIFVNVIASVFTTLVGLKISSIFNVSQKSTSMTMKRIEAVFEGDFSTLKEFVILFRPLGSEFVKIGSLESVLSMCRIVLFMVVLIFGLMAVPRLFGIRCYISSVNRKADNSVVEFVLSSLITIFVWNYFIVSLTEAQARYHIIGAIPLMICAAICYDQFFSKDTDTAIPSIVSICISFIFVIANVLSVRISRVDFHHSVDFIYKTIDATKEMMDVTDVDTVFFYGGGCKEMMRVSYSGVFNDYDESEPFSETDYYAYTADRSFFSDRNLLVINKNEAITNCPEYIQESYVPIYANEECAIYYSDKCPIDGMAGFPLVDYSVDLPLSCNYLVNGKNDSRGYLITSEKGEILRSPDLELAGDRDCQMTIEYESSSPSNAMKLIIYKDNMILDEIPMTTDTRTIEYLFTEPGSYQFVITKSDSREVEIGEISFKMVE